MQTKSETLEKAIIEQGVVNTGDNPSGPSGYGAFSMCSSLTSVEIPNSLKSIEGSVFKAYTGLINIKIPTSVTSIGSSAFYQCTNITVMIPNSVTNISWQAFYTEIRKCNLLSKSSCKGLVS